MDEPTITQPVMYEKINSHPTITKIYSEELIQEKILNEDDTGCFISTEDHEGNETTQDDNVLMKEMSDALLLEDSETETLNSSSSSNILTPGFDSIW